MGNQVGWLIRVATNLSLSHRRWSARKARQLPAPRTVEDTPTDPSVEKALAALTPAQRAAIVLRFYLDLSITETADVLSKRPGTVRALTSQGIARLRAHLGESWLEVHDD
jgi:DNA-directed RNA polymerase specialized sigma24 family protein